MTKCPRCGYESEKGSRVVRIWCSEDTEKEWDDYAKEYKTKKEAFESLLRRAKAFKSRVAVG